MARTFVLIMLVLVCLSVHANDEVEARRERCLLIMEFNQKYGTEIAKSPPPPSTERCSYENIKQEIAKERRMQQFNKEMDQLIAEILSKPRVRDDAEVRIDELEDRIEDLERELNKGDF